MSLALFLGALASVASGGPSVDGQRDPVADAALSTFADCIVVRFTPSSRKFVAGGLEGALADQVKGDVTNGQCLLDATGGAGMLRMQNDLLRSAIARVLFRRDFSDRPPPATATIAPLDWPAEMTLAEYDAKLAKIRKETDRRRFQEGVQLHVRAMLLGQFSECVIRHDAVGARRVLLTKEGSAEETTGINILSSAMSECLPILSEDAEKARFDRSTLRSSMYLAYVRLALAQPAMKAS